MGGDGLYKRRTVFPQSHVIATLHLGCWPPGIIFRSYDDLDWLQVVEEDGEQRLASLDGRRVLRAKQMDRLEGVDR